MRKKESIVFEEDDVIKILTLFCKKKFPKMEVERVETEDGDFEVVFKSTNLDEEGQPDA